MSRLDVHFQERTVALVAAAIANQGQRTKVILNDANGFLLWLRGEDPFEDGPTPPKPSGYVIDAEADDDCNVHYSEST